MNQIVVGGKNFNLISIPGYPGFSDMQMSLVNNAALVQSPYVLAQSQVQEWPGSDAWMAEVQLPPMDRVTAAPWRAFLAESHGIVNVFQLGDQGAHHHIRSAVGSQPVVDGSNSANNLVTQTTLYTKGWKPTSFRLMLPGDYFQVGYRLYMVAGQIPVSSDANGNAAIPVLPSLRDTPPDSTPLILSNPLGLFRMQQNRRDWHTAVTRFVSINFKVIEVR